MGGVVLNTSWMANTGTTPYEITFGRRPFNFPEYLAGSSKVDAVDDLLIERDKTFQLIHKKLLKAQSKMKLYADKHRRDVQFVPGDWVLVRLRPYRQSSAKGDPSTNVKLARRYYGPFQVTAKIGPVAYRVNFPAGVRIHPVFHCSNLKPFRGEPGSTPAIPLPPNFHENQPLIFPLAILGSRRATAEPHNPWQVLVQWQGLSPEETSWEDWDQLRQDYHLEDKVILQGPGDDTGIGYEEEDAEEEEDQSSAQEKKKGVQGEEKPKRRIVKPSYLKDYV